MLRSCISKKYFQSALYISLRCTKSKFITFNSTYNWAWRIVLWTNSSQILLAQGSCMLACMQMFPNSFVAISFFIFIKGNLQTGWLDGHLFHYLWHILEDNFPKLLLWATGKSTCSALTAHPGFFEPWGPLFSQKSHNFLWLLRNGTQVILLELMQCGTMG